MDIYREEVLDHYKSPRNQGKLVGDDVLTASGANSSCGDSITIYVQVHDRKIVAMRWEGTGCAISTAAASKLSQYLQGQSLKDVRAMSEEELTRKAIGLEVNPGRLKCLMLPATVVRKLLAHTTKT